MKEKIVNLVKKLKKCLKNEKDIVFAILFGSVARGNTTEESDIDIAISFVERPDYNRIIDLILKISRCLNAREDKIDITIIDDKTPLELRYKIIRDGILIFAKDIEKFKRFRDYSISLYLDFKEALEAVKYGRKYIEKAEEFLWS